MATHNDGRLLQSAIFSICDGDYPVDLYVVDDCSEPPAKVPAAAASRTTLIRLERNVGLTRALNEGLRHILPRQYDYVARMDADDISYPERIGKQVRFLEENAGIAGVGCWANYVDPDTMHPVFKCRPPTEPEAIRRELHFNNCLLHPTWMMRTEVFDRMEGYNERYPVAQDYEFMARASASGYAFANIPEILLDYRISPSGISVRKRRQQLQARLKIQVKSFCPTVMASWVGIAKTAALFFTPASLVKLVKARRFAHRADGTP